ncbi:peroxisomal membrane protein PMP34-like [Ornithodoros turicata]|uniref:Putative mitochondrial carrier protein n=1 Tax=Ornithodoros turicata TaxID=34597 RepID=A0A2R5LM62_9ACAR
MSKPVRWDNLFTYDTLVHAIAGAAGSTFAMTVFFPLDTVRSRLQVEEHRECKNTVALLEELIKEEGISTVYRGLGPVLTSLWCSNFVYFYSFHGLRAVFTRDASQHSSLRDLFLGSVAGIINVLLTTPLWVVNTRIKMQGVKLTAADREKLRRHPKYQGIFHGLVEIAKTEGPQALWASTLPSMMLVSNPAIQFMMYEALKRRAARLNVNVNSLLIFAFGATSKVVSSCITYPLQVVQSKLRYGASAEFQTKSLIGMFMHILRNQGVPGLYRGLEAKLFQTVLTAALMLVAYEKIVKFVFHILRRSKVA